MALPWPWLWTEIGLEKSPLYGWSLEDGKGSENVPTLVYQIGRSKLRS